MEKMPHSIFSIVYSTGQEKSLKFQQNKDNYIEYMYVHLRTPKLIVEADRREWRFRLQLRDPSNVFTVITYDVLCTSAIEN